MALESIVLHTVKFESIEEQATKYIEIKCCFKEIDKIKDNIFYF